jgi:tRNA pseudouridine-54 N-methylase
MQPESIMLRFIQLLPQASLSGNFLLKDLPGSGKRIDVLCRDLAACFSWGPKSWPKESVELIAIISNSRILTFNYPGKETPHSEVEWASIIKDSLMDNPPDYVNTTDGSLEETIIKFHKPVESSLWVLEENGSHISTIVVLCSATIEVSIPIQRVSCPDTHCHEFPWVRRVILVATVWRQ